jgi:hypothetical protein
MEKATKEEPTLSKPLSETLDEMHELAEVLHEIVRASDGLPPREKTLLGLTNTDKIEQITRLSSKMVLVRSYLRMVHKVGGWEFEACKILADFIDNYSISINGESRKEAILGELGKRVQSNLQQSLVLPNVQTTSEPPKKKHFWNRTDGGNTQ